MQNYKNYHNSLVLISFKYETSVSQLHTGYVLILLPKTNRYTPDLSEMCSIEVYVITMVKSIWQDGFFSSMHRLLTIFKDTKYIHTRTHIGSFLFWFECAKRTCSQ